MILALTAVALSAYAIGRAQKIKQQSAPAPAAATHHELRGEQKAAILLMCLPPEVSGELFKQLGPNQVHRVTNAISQLPQIQPYVREEVCREYMSAARQAGGSGPSSNRSALQEVDELSRDFPAIAAKLIAGLWLN